MLLMGLSCLAENQQSSRLQAAAPWVAVATQLQLAPNYKEMSLSALVSIPFLHSLLPDPILPQGLCTAISSAQNAGP